MPVTSDQTNSLSNLLSSCNHPVFIWAMTLLPLCNISDLPWVQNHLTLMLAPVLGTWMPWISSLTVTERKVPQECGWTHWPWASGDVFLSLCLHCLKWGRVSQDTRAAVFTCAAPSRGSAKRCWIFGLLHPEVWDKVDDLIWICSKFLCSE